MTQTSVEAGIVVTDVPILVKISDTVVAVPTTTVPVEDAEITALVGPVILAMLELVAPVDLVVFVMLELVVPVDPVVVLAILEYEQLSLIMATVVVN
ncbi:MAG: hypothetical protein M1821_007441 [Bathelium mastoideum]|nr:MAG: hypothetical protein M1821_007441 [Bathelium mastoideum]